MKKIILIASVSIVGFNSCDSQTFGPGAQDYTKELPNDYMVFRSSSHEIKVVPEDGWGSKTPIIPTKVKKLNTYNEYVIAFRQGLKPRSPDNPNDGYMIPDPNNFDYWILDTKSPFAYKELDKSEFERIKDSLSIPNSIELIDVYEFSTK